MNYCGKFQGGYFGIRLFALYLRHQSARVVLRINATSHTGTAYRLEKGATPHVGTAYRLEKKAIPYVGAVYRLENNATPHMVTACMI